MAWLAGFALLFLIISSLLSLTINVSLAEGGTTVGGQITSNTTWTKANSPYIVTSNLLVPKGVTLTIEPLAVVKFDSGKMMQIDGCLIARGTETEIVTFTSNQLYPKPGDWKGIEFTSSSIKATYDAEGNYINGSIMKYCSIKYGGDHYTAALKITKASPHIDHCNITNNSYTGIYVENSRLNITNSNIRYNNLGSAAYYVGYYGGGIYVSGGEVVIRGNTISNNLARLGGGGIFTGNAVVLISNNIISNNSGVEYGKGGGIYIQSGTVTIDDNTINDNSAYSCGGVYVDLGRAIIRNNTISGNTAYRDGGGISIISGAVIIEGNIITNNSNGICIYYGGYVSICLNEIYGNAGNGIVISYNYRPTSTTIIDHNNIYDNHPYDISNQGQMKIDATSNWWGTTDEATIQAHIYDWSDNTNYGVVIFKPYLTSPVTDFTRPTTPVVTDDGNYTTSTTQLHASWSSSDLESGIIEYQYAIGSSPGSNNIVNWTSVGTKTEVTHTGLSLTIGSIYYFAVKARNGQGVWSYVGTSDGITVIAISFGLSQGWETKELFVPIYYRSREHPGEVVIGVYNKRDMWYLVKVYKKLPDKTWGEIIPQEFLGVVGPYIGPYSEKTFIFPYVLKEGDEIKIEVLNDLNDNALAALWALDLATRAFLGVSISPQITEWKELKTKLLTFYNDYLEAVGYLRLGKWKQALLQFGKALVSNAASQEFADLLKHLGVKTTAAKIATVAAKVVSMPLFLAPNVPIWWDFFKNANREPFREEVIFTVKRIGAPKLPNLKVTKGLTIVQDGPYYIGETINANFTIKNKGTAPITLNVLTVGGRGPKGDGDVRDFTFKLNITLNPNESYNYEGELKLLENGSYHFFIAYQTADGEWVTSVPTEAGAVNTLDINVNPIPESWIGAELCSPGELRVYDSQGKVTGLINGKERNDIPHSACYENMIAILSPNDSYRYQVVGISEGSYNLTVTSVVGDKSTTFTAIDIPTSAKAIHQYTINWDALSRGEKGITLQIDSNGDGTFERSITSDKDFTRAEFTPSELPFWIWIIVGVVVISIGGIIITRLARRKNSKAQNKLREKFSATPS